MSEEEIRRNYTFLSHAVRSLAIWRGQEPWEAWQRLSSHAAGGQTSRDAPADGSNGG
jgi:hypothetical protein